MDHGSHARHADHGARADHGAHADHAAAFRDRFWWSLILAVPVVATSSMIQEWFGFGLPSFPGDDLVGPALGTALFLCVSAMVDGRSRGAPAPPGSLKGRSRSGR